MSHLEFLFYTLKHKWYVWIAGRCLGVPVRQLILHDLSKFSKAEWGAYVNRFHRVQAEINTPQHTQVLLDFQRAWSHHVRHNPHHWEHWLRVDKAEPMPDVYLREMIADWYGAGMAQGRNDIQAWWKGNRHRIILHPETERKVDGLIHELLKSLPASSAKVLQ